MTVIKIPIMRQIFIIFIIFILMTGCAKEGEVTPPPRVNSPFSTIVSHYNGSPAKWQQFLDCWWMKRRSKTSPEIVAKFEPYWASIKYDARINSRRIELDINALERKLNSKMPPSYRDFLMATGGRYLFPYHSLQFDASVGKDEFYQPQKVDLFAKLEPKYSILFGETTKGIKFSDEQYYRYGYDSTGLPIRNDAQYNSSDINHLILIGSAYLYGNMLLNPKEKTVDGELEAWNIYENLSGAARYRSFAELMQDVYLNEIDAKREFRGIRIKEDTCALILFDAPLQPFEIRK